LLFSNSLIFLLLCNDDDIYFFHSCVCLGMWKYVLKFLHFWTFKNTFNFLDFTLFFSKNCCSHTDIFASGGVIFFFKTAILICYICCDVNVANSNLKKMGGKLGESREKV
jgi:hypothetical protein